MKKSFFSKKKIGVSNYSAFIYYYIIRNHIWLTKCSYVTKKEKKSIKHNYVIMPFLKVILFEKNKINKI